MWTPSFQQDELSQRMNKVEEEWAAWHPTEEMEVLVKRSIDKTWDRFSTGLSGTPPGSSSHR